jgi:ABC-type sulfate transport system substrate-binding protein
MLLCCLKMRSLASDVFYKKGQGDVLLNYENEVILAAQQVETKPFYVVPQTNISIDALVVQDIT